MPINITLASTLSVAKRARKQSKHMRSPNLQQRNSMPPSSALAQLAWRRLLPSAARNEPVASSLPPPAKKKAELIKTVDMQRITVSVIFLRALTFAWQRTLSIPLFAAAGEKRRQQNPHFRLARSSNHLIDCFIARGKSRWAGGRGCRKWRGRAERRRNAAGRLHSRLLRIRRCCSCLLQAHHNKATFLCVQDQRERESAPTIEEAIFPFSPISNFELVYSLGLLPRLSSTRSSNPHEKKRRWSGCNKEQNCQTEVLQNLRICLQLPRGETSSRL
jgi:hypothetical protein